MPYFSIIVPSYNRAENVRKLILSVSSQTFEDYELIIVDDGSTDDTENVVSSLLTSRIRYFKTRNNERAIARNFGLARASGTYVNYFDSDDLMYADRLQSVYDFLREHGQPEIAFTHYDFVDEDGKVLGKTERFAIPFSSNLWFNNFLASGAVFVKREIALENRFCEDRRLITAEDWELWLRLHRQYPFAESDRRTFAIVQHKNRSIVTIQPDKVVLRDAYFAELIRQDQSYEDVFGSATVNLFVADRFSFIALMFAMNGNRTKALQYLSISLKSSLRVLGRRRFWGVLKNLL